MQKAFYLNGVICMHPPKLQTPNTFTRIHFYRFSCFKGDVRKKRNIVFLPQTLTVIT